jgi:hypothetical protein
LVSREMGWCPDHYARWLVLNANESRCQVAKCERPGEVERRICRRHYNQARCRARRNLQLAAEPADPSLRKLNPCKEPGCEERKFQLGFCTQHYQQWLSSTRSTVAETLQVRPTITRRRYSSYPSISHI